MNGLRPGGHPGQIPNGFRRVGYFPEGRPAGQPNPLHREEQARRDQERRDEILARRIEMLGLDGVDVDADLLLRPTGWAIRDEQHFAHRAAGLISGAAMHAMATARNAPAPRPRHDMIPPPPVPPQPVRNAHAHLPRQQPPLRHRHSAASRQYNNSASTRPSERVVPRRAFADYELEAENHRPDGAPAVALAVGAPAEAPGPARPGQRHSVMAGLTGGSGGGRVDEWRRHIGED